jgi:hypothetical protein
MSAEFITSMIGSEAATMAGRDLAGVLLTFRS